MDSVGTGAGIWYWYLNNLYTESLTENIIIYLNVVYYSVVFHINYLYLILIQIDIDCIRTMDIMSPVPPTVQTAAAIFTCMKESGWKSSEVPAPFPASFAADLHATSSFV